MNHPGDAVSPNIFDAHAHPDLILPLVLANLLSEHLWDFSARLMQRVAKAQSQSSPQSGALAQVPGDAGLTADTLAPALREVQRQIDRHFEHLSHERVIEISGVLDLRQERARLGDAVVNAALDNIIASFTWRESRGTARGTESIKQCIASGKFPAYFYATFDVVRANRRGVRHRKNVPMGLTSCLDEVAIFSALVMTLPAQTVDTVVILASPAHYTAFGWSPLGETWWFYGKNALYSEGQWHARVAQDYNGDAQLAFEDCLPFADRVISIAGSHDFKTGSGSIPPDRLEILLAQLDRFFGARVIAAADPDTQQGTTFSSPDFAPLFRELLGAESIGKVRERLLSSERQRQEITSQMVLSSYRSLAVSDTGSYLVAARNSPACRRIGANLTCVDDAIAVVRNVSGQESIFNDRERLAMPEETLRLDTGSDRDRALLLHVLLELMFAAKGQRVALACLFTQEDSFVCGPDFCIGMRDLAPAAVPASGVLIRIADSSPDALAAGTHG